ncbi:DUF4908 domain-containing protein [Hirschia baltica]|nr:DUF4908 domain-containing protein [Hirschia baltica]
MKHSRRNYSRVLLLASALVVGFVAPAMAYDPPRPSNADLVSMLNAQLAPSTRPAYYRDSSSGRRFLFDRTGPHALLKYEDEDEVFALRASNGPRGDQFYRTDTGRVFLRVTELGNVIVFPFGDRHGAPTTLDATSNAIIPPPHPTDFKEALRQVSSNLAETLGEAPRISVDKALSDYADWTMEAVQTASIGVELAKKYANVDLRSISLKQGDAARLSIQGTSLSIVIAPADGFAGRPSSEAIAKAYVSLQ